MRTRGRNGRMAVVSGSAEPLRCGGSTDSNLAHLKLLAAGMASFHGWQSRHGGDQHLLRQQLLRQCCVDVQDPRLCFRDGLPLLLAVRAQNHHPDQFHGVHPQQPADKAVVVEEVGLAKWLNQSAHMLKTEIRTGHITTLTCCTDETRNAVLHQANECLC